MLVESILLRESFRSDYIWAHPLLFRSPFRKIPYHLDTWALLNSQFFPRKKLRAIQIKRFKKIVKHASLLPFWKERFTRIDIKSDSFEEKDIAQIPLLTKSDLRKKDISTYTIAKLLPKSREYYTSGSTGKPLRFYHDQQFELRRAAVEERMLRTAGNGKRYPCIYIKSVAEMGLEYAKYYFFFLRGYNSVQYRIEELIRLIRSFPQGVVLFGFGSSLLELARICGEKKSYFRCAASFQQEKK